MRVGAIFVPVCMALIAGSAGVAAYAGLGLTGVESGLIAIAILTALIVYNATVTRQRLNSAAGNQVAELLRGSAEIARQIAELDRRLAAVEHKMEGALSEARAVSAPLAGEIGELGSLVKQLADTVAAHEARLAQTAPPSPEPPPAAAVGGDQPRVAPAVSVPAEPEAKQAADAGQSRASLQALIREAIKANRIDFYLQPIVTLPQRKVHYYEALSRVRNDEGEVLPAADFIAQADSAGLLPKIDNLMAFRCVQVVRRLLLKNREIGVFCNLAGATLTDSTVFPQLLDFLDANRAIASSIILELTQSALRAAGPIENESLSALADRGFRFSLDNVRDLRIEPRELAARGFRFVKVAAQLLLKQDGAPSDIHPGDLSGLLGRFGIDLIAEKIESETSVVDLLDYDVRFGQGFLFSPPRPVRAEALQAKSGRAAAQRRETTAEQATATTPLQRTVESPAGREPPERLSGLAQIARRV